MRYRAPRHRGKSSLQGFCKLTILLLLPCAVLPAPQRFKRMDAGLNDTNSETDQNKALTSLEGKKGETQGLSGNNDSNANWVKPIRELFLKWGYTDEDIPEPFGSKKSPDMDAPSPEFGKILKGIEDSIPVDLRSQIEDIIHSDGVKRSDGSSGDKTKLDEIEETIREIEADLKADEEKSTDANKIKAALQESQNKSTSMMQTSKESPGTESKKNIPNDHKTFCAQVDGPCNDEYEDGEASSNTTTESKKHISNDHKTFCAEVDGPCNDEYEDGEAPSNTTNISVNAQKLDKDKLSQDKDSLETLIEHLKSIMGKPKEMTPDDSSKAKDDLNQISTLVHEIETIAENNVKPCNMDTLNNNEKEIATSPAILLGTTEQPKTNELKMVASTTSTPEDSKATTPQLKLNEDLAANEKHIVDNMKRYSSLDVSVVGNDIKEVGHQLGIIAEQERERAASGTHEASPEERQSIAKLLKKIDENGHEKVEKDRSHPDLHKQVQEMDNLVSELQDIQSSAKHKNKEIDNVKAEVVSKSKNDEVKTKGSSVTEIKGGSLIEINTNSNSKDEKEELKNMLKLEVDEVSKINHAHEQHKADMVGLIHKLKLSSNSENDKERIQKIEDLIEDIDREHHNALDLQEKLSLMAEEKEVEHIHSEKHGYKSNKHHDSLENKIESLKKSGDGLAAKVGQSEYDTTIEETLHSKKILSTGSKHHNEKDNPQDQSMSLNYQGHEEATVSSLTNSRFTDALPQHNVEAGVANSQNDISDMKEHLKASSPTKFSMTQFDQDRDSISQGTGGGLLEEQNQTPIGKQIGESQNTKSLKPLQQQTQKFDELALERAEVNYNGGIHAKIEEMKNVYPNGKWADDDVWKDKDVISGSENLHPNQEQQLQAKHVSTNQEREASLHTEQYATEKSNTPLQTHQESKDIEKAYYKEGEGKQSSNTNDKFDPQIKHEIPYGEKSLSDTDVSHQNHLNEHGEDNLNSIEADSPSIHVNKDNGALEYGNLLSKPMTDNNEGNVPEKSDSSPQESVDTINLEHELELIEGSRVDSILNILDNGPSEAKFVDFHTVSLAHHQALPSIQQLSPENLESIIKAEHGMSKSMDKNGRGETYHHVQEHELTPDPPKYHKRLFRQIKKKMRRS